MPDNNTNTYFAAQEAEKTASTLLQKATSFFNVLEANSYLEKLNRMWRAYHGAYGGDNNGHEISFMGEQGELVSLPVNHFRNLAQHMLNMITANRPVMEARAINTDYKSLAQTYLANGILDYYMKEKHLEDALKKAVEMAIVLGAGFIKLEWNATSGEAYDFDEETGQFNYEGELEFSNLSPFDVVVDGTKESWNNEWILVRGFQNRFNLMAKYPEQAERISRLPSKNEATKYRIGVFSNDDTDDIPVFEFYHKKSEAMPDGRYLLFLDSDVVLLDAKLPYRTMPIFRVTAGDIIGTPYGYSPMFDVFPIQEGINSLYSTIMTNQNAFGGQSLFVQRGADIAISTLEGAMNIIEGNFKPEPLQLTQTAPEVFKFLEMLIESAETISGINSVARGNPEASLNSGAALALIQSMALQFISGLQQGYVRLIEDTGTALISILKDYAHTPKVVALVGKNNRPLLKEFTGDQINAINRVIVDVGNPLARSTAGRVQIAEQLIQMGLVKNPQQYFQVLNTGRLDTMFEGEMSELLLIKQENEQLLEGQPIPTTFLDQHRMHIMEHRSVLADPDLRRDANLVNNVLQHIQTHIDLLRTTDPDTLMMINEQPLMQPGEMPMPGQPGAMGQPPMGQPPQRSLERSNNSDVMGQDPNAQQVSKEQARGTVLPQMPKPPGEFANMPVLAEEMPVR